MLFLLTLFCVKSFFLNINSIQSTDKSNIKRTYNLGLYLYLLDNYLRQLPLRHGDSDVVGGNDDAISDGQNSEVTINGGIGKSDNDVISCDTIHVISGRNGEITSSNNDVINGKNDDGTRGCNNDAVDENDTSFVKVGNNKVIDRRNPSAHPLLDVGNDEYIELLLKLVALERRDVERGETMLECLQRLRDDLQRFIQFYSKQESKCC